MENALLEKYGYIIFDFLNQEELDLIKKLSDLYIPSDVKGFYSTSHFLNVSESIELNKKLFSIVQQKFEALFVGLELTGGTFATKKMGNSVVDAHQDWTIVDETKYRSYNLWIPLVDTNKENGTLALVSGSHKWFEFKRGMNVKNPFLDFTNLFLNYCDEPILKMGQAILYDHRLIHLSRGNNTNSNRDTLIFGVKEKEAKVILCIAEDNLLSEYEMEIADYYRMDVEQIKRKNKLIRRYQNTIPKLDKGKLLDLLA